MMHRRTLASNIWKSIIPPSALRGNWTAITIRDFATAHNQGQQTSSQQDHDAKPAEQGKSELTATNAKPKPNTLTTTERDEQLRRKMSGLSGDGGEAGVEYEDGKPVAMKRSVKNNMFRYI